MVELEKRISGDWIEIKSKANNLPGLLELLAVPALAMRTASGKLRQCVEQGVVEFKRTMLAPVLVALETSRYKSLDGGEMGEHEGSLSLMLLAILTQRLLATQVLPLSQRQRPKPVVDVESLGLNAILSDINSRIKADPGVRSHSAVKNILMQVQLYTRENQKMRELLPTIKPDMRTAFLANFTRTFGNIVGSIRRQYGALLEEQVASQQASPDSFSLANLSLKELAPLLASQAREVSRMRSTFGWAPKERFDEALRSTVLWYRDHESWWRKLLARRIDFARAFSPGAGRSTTCADVAAARPRPPARQKARAGRKAAARKARRGQIR